MPPAAPPDLTAGQVIHRTDRATVIIGDAREVLAGIPTQTVGLVIVDPPYGIEWQSARRAEAFAMLDGDGENEREGVRDILRECVRVVGKSRHLYVFGPGDVLEGLQVTEPVELIWAKQALGAGDLTAPWGPMHEPISFLVSKQSFAGQAGATGNVAARLRKGSVLTHTRKTGRNVRHPSEKPVALIADLIESSSRAGELVLDPCAGSGSTGVAAVLRGRRALLIESHPDYAQLCADRLRVAEAAITRAEAA
jgi:DNA modification methylase